ncbi:hypothetical protein CR513_32307, partial [Mucuna pruriens]
MVKGFSKMVEKVKVMERMEPNPRVASARSLIVNFSSNNDQQDHNNIVVECFMLRVNRSGLRSSVSSAMVRTSLHSVCRQGLSISSAEDQVTYQGTTGSRQC